MPPLEEGRVLCVLAADKSAGAWLERLEAMEQQAQTGTVVPRLFPSGPMHVRMRNRIDIVKLIKICV